MCSTRENSLAVEPQNPKNYWLVANLNLLKTSLKYWVILVLQIINMVFVLNFAQIQRQQQYLQLLRLIKEKRR
jgi:hypothetical protein